METLQEFMAQTKLESYMVAIPFVLVFLGYYLFLMGGRASKG